MSFYHPLKVAPPPLIAFVTKTEVSKDNKKLVPLPCIAYVDQTEVFNDGNKFYDTSLLVPLGPRSHTIINIG